MKKYLIKDIRLGASEQDKEDYTLEELKEYFEINLNYIDDEDIEEFEKLNEELEKCEDIDDLTNWLNECWNDFYSFEEVE
jgi:hypothetical protein